MSNYIQSTLIPNEEILSVPKIHPIVYCKAAIYGAMWILFCLLFAMVTETHLDLFFVMTVCFVMAVPFMVYDALYYSRIEMAVTNRRVVVKSGIISINSEELQWNKIESIEMKQGIFGRIFGYGDIFFSGTGTSYVRFGYVQNPLEVKSQAAAILTER